MDTEVVFLRRKAREWRLAAEAAMYPHRQMYDTLAASYHARAQALARSTRDVDDARIAVSVEF
jgi:hypothetical protein